MNNLSEKLHSPTPNVLESLQDLQTIRKQAQRMLTLARQDKLPYFSINEEKMADTADFVLAVMHDQYPSLQIPYHTRWRHFEAGGIDRVSPFHERIKVLSLKEQRRILFELVIISVFLDAGSGKQWRYFEAKTGQTFCRSEGLAIASLTMYEQGIFSAIPNQPYRVDSERLLTVAQSFLEQGFQVGPNNPLDGLAGRVALLNRLGKTLAKQVSYFGTKGRLGEFYDCVDALQINQSIKACTLFQTVLTAFAEVWPQRLQYEGIPLGDVWMHTALKNEIPGSEYVPFHKLSQWLSYSLVEPLEQSGIAVNNLDDLTGLAEYRNGGLLIDMGLLQLKNKAMGDEPLEPGSEIIVEWRALTVALLDELATLIRRKLHKNEFELPLAKILQGGTWEAGRRVAKQNRQDGTPPIQIVSDGTVF